MCEQVLNVIKRWQADERLTAFSEARICSAVIVPILRGLGWDVENPEEVWEQYPVEEIGAVDYALLIGNEPKVLVEVKRGGESLDRHQIQIRNYARIGGVSLATLTNGATWRFYLPLQGGSWERTRVGDVVFHDQNAVEITQKLVHLLSRENVSSGNAIRNAENLQEKNRILEALPAAWEQLVNEKIPNLLATRAQELCGHEPSRNEVEQFLSAHLQHIQITPKPTTPVPSLESDPSSEPSPSGSVTGKKPVAFIFNGSRYEVTSWKGMFVRLCKIVHSAHRDRFEEVLSLKGKTKPPFSRNADGMASPVQINNSGIFAETHGDAQAIVKRAERLIVHFEYDKNDLSYEFQAL